MTEKEFKTACEYKTNVMRLLDVAKIPYQRFCYVGSNAISGVEVADYLGQAHEQVFKTLVTKGKSNQNYVFVIPSNAELDLKKASKVANEKSIEMLKSKELLPLTGYIHGGCSPIGMKKFFPTFFDETALLFDEIFFSAGKIGYQVKIATADIQKIIKISFADVAI